MVSMSDYKKMYFALFNAVTMAIEQLEDAQKRGEATYIESSDTPLTIFSMIKDENSKNDK